MGRRLFALAPDNCLVGSRTSVMIIFVRVSPECRCLVAQPSRAAAATVSRRLLKLSRFSQPAGRPAGRHSYIVGDEIQPPIWRHKSAECRQPMWPADVICMANATNKPRAAAKQLPESPVFGHEAGECQALSRSRLTFRCRRSLARLAIRPLDGPSPR